MDEKKNKHDKCDCGKHEKCGCNNHEKCGCGKHEKCDCGEHTEQGCCDKKCKCHEQDNAEVMHEQNGELEKLKKEAAAYLELAQRITAEFDNYRKRNLELAKTSEQNGVILAVQKILPIVDAFDNAFKMVKDEGSKEGLKLIYDMIFSALKDLGIEEIDALGKDFDPDFHNAVIATEGEGEAGKILEVYQKGFKLGERIIRYSMVRVSK